MISEAILKHHYWAPRTVQEHKHPHIRLNIYTQMAFPGNNQITALQLITAKTPCLKIIIQYTGINHARIQYILCKTIHWKVSIARLGYTG